ncbi:MAG TPA: TRAP transporter small permease [Burkholderiales bacterium]|nr:TRAP transporter small permease [Burkholderiales bacterium]
MRRFLDRLYAASGALAACCVFLICALMLAQAFARSTGGQIRGTDEVVSWLCAAAAFFALGHTFRHGELVRVGLLISRLPPAGRRVAEILSLLVAALLAGYTIWALTDYMLFAAKSKYMTQGLIVIPEWVPQTSFLAGMAIFLVAVLDELLRVLKKQKPAYQQAEEDRVASGDFSETV